MQILDGTKSRRPESRCAGQISTRRIFSIWWAAIVAKKHVRQGDSHDAVMLHLRDGYVSKAAILTVPARPVPVENRSPA
jgi:hypothetical protein